MDIEILDSVKQTMNIQQKFMKKNKDMFDAVNRHNDYLQRFYDQSNIQHIISMTSKYDYYIKTVGKYAYIPASPAHNFYKSDYYKNVYSSVYNIEKYIPNYAKTDFRFQVQTQKLMSQVKLLNEKFNDVSKPEINELEIEFDKLISEPLINTTNHNQSVNNDADIRSVIAEIHESQKCQEETLREIVKNSKQNEPSEQSDKSFFDNFQLLIIVIFGVITKPKEFYEAVIWINDILSTLIDHFFS